MTSNHYANLPNYSYWKTGVQAAHPLEPKDIYRKKFPILPTDRIATAGSCFAQHIARHMRASGFSVLDVEPAPSGISTELAQKYGYKLYSGRYGNIYTSRQLLQLAQSALGKRPSEDIVWQSDGRFFDALRPSVEPTGLESPELVIAHREHHLKRVRRLLKNTDIFIFTFGLTETWENTDTNLVYPTSPGVISSPVKETKIFFKNLKFNENLSDFIAFRELLKSINDNVKFILTVSPVPLTATATGNHVLPATVYSKSVLRAVAGELASEYDDIDYFPSYEIVTSPSSKGVFYDSNMRTINKSAVNIVMNTFFNEHKSVLNMSTKINKNQTETVCEEQLLEAFAS